MISTLVLYGLEAHNPLFALEKAGVEYRARPYAIAEPVSTATDA